MALTDSGTQYTPTGTGDNNFQLIYPDDANPDNFFPEAIRFAVHKRTGVSLKIVLDAAVDHAKSLKALSDQRRRIKDSGGSDADIKAQIDAANRAWEKANPLMGPAPITIKEGILKTAQAIRQGHKEEGRSLKQSKTTTELLGTIYLNMPNNIQYSEDAGWNPSELGLLGQMTKSVVEGGAVGVGAKAAGGIAGASGSLVGGAVGGAMAKVASIMGLGGSSLIGVAVGAVAAGSGLQRGAEAAMSVAQNPYMEMMFSGIGFRQFKFDFVMRPKDEQEVRTVGNILQMFREHARPSYVGGTFRQTFMNYPQEFHISFLTYDEGSAPLSEVFTENLHLPKLKPCVCTSVESNYTPQSIWTAYRGGASPAINLSLGFQESELVMASDVQDGF